MITNHAIMGANHQHSLVMASYIGTSLNSIVGSSVSTLGCHWMSLMSLLLHFDFVRYVLT